MHWIDCWLMPEPNSHGDDVNPEIVEQRSLEHGSEPQFHIPSVIIKT